MTKHVCGTCRFFKAAGFDNMGWCTNPRRRQGTDSLILVRSLELPCRNDWASDLWQSSETAGDSVDQSGIAAAPERPISIDEVRFLTSRRPVGDDGRTAELAAAQGEDIVVDEGVALPPRDNADRKSELRGTVRRAHEEMRLKNRERRPGLSPESSHGEFSVPEDAITSATVSVSANNTLAMRGFDSSLPTARIGEVPPVSLGELGRPIPKITTYASDADVFGTIPTPVKDFDLPLISRPKATRVVGRAGFDAPEPSEGIVPWDNASERPIPADERLPIAEPAVVRGGNVATAKPAPMDEEMFEPVPVRRERELPLRRWRDERGGDDRGDRSSLLSPDVLRNDGASFAAEPIPRRHTPERDEGFDVERGESLNGRAIDRRLSAAAVEEILNPQRGDFESIGQDRANRQHEAEPLPPLDNESDAVDQVARTSTRYDGESTVEPAAETPTQWASVPRVCRTCRDFRPAENGERGWCTNKWAFSHRRMVDADELPCETSIGGWWLPNDDLWLSAVDVSAHGQPTPLVDQWLAAKAAARGEYDVVAPLRRRQRS